MVLRECVWRNARLPQTIVVDGGPDFRSTYFETLVTYYHCTKATRPWAKPHYGSVCERLSRTSNTEFIHNLLGNTQVMKQVRQVTKAMQPQEHAAWTLVSILSEMVDHIEHTQCRAQVAPVFQAGEKCAPSKYSSDMENGSTFARLRKNREA